MLPPLLPAIPWAGKVEGGLLFNEDETTEGQGPHGATLKPPPPSMTGHPTGGGEGLTLVLPLLPQRPHSFSPHRFLVASSYLIGLAVCLCLWTNHRQHALVSQYVTQSDYHHLPMRAVSLAKAQQRLLMDMMTTSIAEEEVSSREAEKM